MNRNTCKPVASVMIALSRKQLAGHSPARHVKLGTGKRQGLALDFRLEGELVRWSLLLRESPGSGLVGRFVDYPLR